MITIATANAYFAPKKHLFAAEWSGAPADRREAALNIAHQTLSRLLGREVVDTATANGDSPREDVATLELALYYIRNGVGDGSASSFGSQDPDDPVAPREADTDSVPQQVIRWLFPFRAEGRPAVELKRG